MYKNYYYITDKSSLAKIKKETSIEENKTAAVIDYIIYTCYDKTKTIPSFSIDNNKFNLEKITSKQLDCLSNNKCYLYSISSNEKILDENNKLVRDVPIKTRIEIDNIINVIIKDDNIIVNDNEEELFKNTKKKSKISIGEWDIILDDNDLFNPTRRYTKIKSVNNFKTKRYIKLK